MEQPVICVIVPVYKAEATLPRCIESVLTQQLPGGLRLILVQTAAAKFVTLTQQRIPV